MQSQQLPRVASKLMALLFALNAGFSVAGQKSDVRKHRSATEKHRLIWISNPSSEAVFGWNQLKGDPATLHYGTKDFGRDFEKYPVTVTPVRIQKYDGMKNCFARLSELRPDTRYFFCLKDDSGVSRRYQFVTAPAQPGDFTFISGGDSRNFRDVRIAANQLCEKLRPLFIAFTGDMINKDEAREWDEWLDDWEHTTGEDGHLIPIVPHRGNHERRPETIPNYFNTPEDAYFAFSVGGDLMRYFVLNSEIPAKGAQEKWLDRELSKSGSYIHLVAGYHKPMRPHVSKKSEGVNPLEWADNFYRFGVDLVLESDSHVMKRTYPLRPDENGKEGFTRASDTDEKATVYIGEGCWGAPLRAADDAKPWTLDCESFNGFDWIKVSPEEILVKTVKIENTSKVERVTSLNSFETPKGLKLWQPKGGEVLTVKAD